MRILLILTVLLSGCGWTKYTTTITIDGKERGRLEGNVPSKAVIDGVEIDQRGLSIIEKLIPKNIRVEK